VEAEVTYDPFDFVNKYPIVLSDAPQQIKTFAAFAQHTAFRYQRGDLGLQEAVDQLRFAVWRHGLKQHFVDSDTAEQELEWIIGFAFAEFGIHYTDIRKSEVNDAPFAGDVE